MRIERPSLSPQRLFWGVGAILGLLLLVTIGVPGWLLWGEMVGDLQRVERRLAAQDDLIRRAERLQGEAARLQPWTVHGPNPLPGKTRAEAREAMAAQILRQAADAGLSPPGLTVTAETDGDRIVTTRIQFQAGPQPLRAFLTALETERPLLSVRELHLRPDLRQAGRLDVELVVAGIPAEVTP